MAYFFNAGHLRHRRMHWRSRYMRTTNTNSAHINVITRQMCDQARHRNAHFRLPDTAHRLGIYHLRALITMTRHEFRQANHTLNQHNRKGWLALLVIVLAYCIVGALEHLA